MQTKQQLNTRFRQIGYSPNIGQIAMDELAGSLDKDETVLQLLEGSFENTLGFVIATDLRIFYIGVDKHKKTRLEQVKYEDVASVENKETWPTSSEIQLTTMRNKLVRIKGCEPNSSKQFVELVRMLTQAPTD